MGGDRKVKEEVVDEVVEVEVQGMLEEKVKEDVEEKAVEEKVIGGGRRGLRTFLGGWAAGAIMDLPRGPAVLAGPTPPNLDHPLLVPPGSPIWTVRFMMHHVHHKILGQGKWVSADEGTIY